MARTDGPRVAKASTRLLILDVDGVLTDGTIFIDDEGRQSRGFHIQDGLGIAMWKAIGRTVAILTSKRSPAVTARAAMLGIDLVEQGAEDKLPGLARLMEQAKAGPEQTAYMGDDLLDLAAMRRVGYPLAPANAVAEVRAIARYVTSRRGGQGAVREAIEHLLKSQDCWATAISAIGADR